MEGADRNIPALSSVSPRICLAAGRLHTTSDVGESSMSVPSVSQTNTIRAAPAIEENAEGAVRGSLGGYGQETLRIQGSNNQMPQAKRNSASGAANAARRPLFEAPTWRNFAGDWR